MTDPAATQERAERGGRLHREAEDPARAARAQGRRVVDTVAARERRGDERERLVPDVRPTRCLPEVEVLPDEVLQAEMLGERRRQEVVLTAIIPVQKGTCSSSAQPHEPGRSVDPGLVGASSRRL